MVYVVATIIVLGLVRMLVNPSAGSSTRLPIPMGLKFCPYCGVRRFNDAYCPNCGGSPNPRQDK